MSRLSPTALLPNAALRSPTAVGGLAIVDMYEGAKLFDCDAVERKVQRDPFGWVEASINHLQVLEPPLGPADKCWVCGSSTHNGEMSAASAEGMLRIFVSGKTRGEFSLWSLVRDGMTLKIPILLTRNDDLEFRVTNSCRLIVRYVAKESR